MIDALQLAVCAVLTYLTRVTRGGVRPEDARPQLSMIAAAHPELSMQLLWEVEAYDNSLHYDVIIVRPKTGDTVSISVCQDRALPWPLRGVLRWTEANVVQVNGRMLTMEDTVGFLDVLWDEAPLMERMVNACLIRQELERDPIVLADDELQIGMDELRRAHGLFTVEETERWMCQRGMTHAQLERLVAGNLACAHLRRRIATVQVANYFESHRSQFDVACIAKIELPDPDSAERLRARVAGGTLGFASAMQEAFVSSDAGVRCAFTSVRRCDGSSEVEAQLFVATPGDVVGPICVGSSYVVACLLELRPACDDELTRTAIEQIIFDQWLAERRRHATITWHWGRVPDPA